MTGIVEMSYWLLTLPVSLFLWDFGVQTGHKAFVLEAALFLLTLSHQMCTHRLSAVIALFCTIFVSLSLLCGHPLTFYSVRNIYATELHLHFTCKQRLVLLHCKEFPTGHV